MKRKNLNIIFETKRNKIMNHNISEKLQDNGNVRRGYLDFSLPDLELKGAIHTAKEISEQPRLWLKIWASLLHQQTIIQRFLKEVYANDHLDIVISGAGTSAFIGNILQGPFQRNTGKRTCAVATTDLVSHPEDYLHPDTPTLLISFARSGNSPESVAAVDLVNTICTKKYHLIISCNPEGNLAQNIQENALTFLLPPEANDQSLAMTGSFTAMLLAGLLISRIEKVEELKDQVEQLAAYGEEIIKNYHTALRKVAALDFQRSVFLGSGPLHGAAREAQLKLQELTDGKVICKYDSFLGFRHGPKAVIDASTLLVYLFSNNEYVHQYETDLVNAVNQGEKGLYRIGVCETTVSDMGLDLVITLSTGQGKIDEEFLPVCSVLPAQMLGFYKSLDLGLKPDSPSVNGAIARVVEGVNIYPYQMLEHQNGL